MYRLPFARLEGSLCPKDSAVGEIKRGWGDETRGEKRGEETEGGGTEEDVGGAGIRKEGRSGEETEEERVVLDDLENGWRKSR